MTDKSIRMPPIRRLILLIPVPREVHFPRYCHRWPVFPTSPDCST
jgi:hypothetical protein